MQTEGPGIYKFFGASKYNEYNLIDVSGIFDRERTLAVDSAGGKLYVGHSNFSSGHIKVFDTINEELVEDIPVPGTPTGVVADETTGTLFVSSGNKVREFPAVIIPDVFAGPKISIGHTTVKVGGKVDPAGGTPVTDCYFEYGQKPATTRPGPSPANRKPRPAHPLKLRRT